MWAGLTIEGLRKEVKMMDLLYDSDNDKKVFVDKKWGERVVMFTTCALSILGSLLIILSYLCFRSLRTKAREILMHISIMDLGVAASNLVGTGVYFDRYYIRPHCYNDSIVKVVPHMCPVSAAISDLCRVQAFFAIYFTLGSVLWTLCLSVYLYFLIVHHETPRAKHALRLSYVFCYVTPFAISMWLQFTGRLGYSPYNSAGWCTIIANNPHDLFEINVFTTVMAYDLWIYLAFLLISVLSLSVHLYIRTELKAVHPLYSSDRIWQALQSIDYKFLLIPLAFIILRIWTCIISITMVYARVNINSIPSSVALVFVYLSGIGDSAQGLVDAVLFVLFTKKVRHKFVVLLCYLCCCPRKKDWESQYGNPWEKKSLVTNVRYNTPTPEDVTQTE